MSCRLIASLGLVFLMSVTVSAEERRSILPTDGQGEFERKRASKLEHFNQISKANEGGANKESKDDQEAIDTMAKWYTYRLTWDSFPKLPGETKTILITDPGVVNGLMGQFEKEVKLAEDAAKGNPTFTEMYLKALAQRARDVIQTSQPIAAVNGARMLARLAEAGSDDAGDACLDALKDEKDFLEPRARAGVQYWALHGLRYLLARWAQTPPGTKIPAARKDRRAAYLQALVAVIERQLPAGTNLGSREEMEGLRSFRREAVRALAQFRGPALMDAGGKTIKLRTGQTLLKVVNDDGLTPPARLDEQVEAAIGVARLSVKSVAAYQPDYAAQQIGYLVAEMGRRARPAGENKTPWENKLPWKIYAARLSDALEILKAEVASSPDKAAISYIDNVIVRSLRVLKDLEATERANAGDLKLWLGTNPVPHTTLYQGLADSTVLPLEKPDSPPPSDKPTGEKKPDQKKPDAKKPDQKKPDAKKPDQKKPDAKKPGKP